jgi:hypothetical protein
MDLEYIIYQSMALIPDDPRGHDAILQACRINNAGNGVTGFLHREGDFFIQYLEGSRDALNRTMRKISADTRHKDILMLDTGPLQERRLPDWQMGFVDGTQMSLHDLMEAGPRGLDLKAEDPFDLVVFMTANAHNLREDATRAA